MTTPKVQKRFEYLEKDGKIWVSLDELLDFFEDMKKKSGNELVSFSGFTHAALLGIRISILRDIKDAQSRGRN